MAMENKLLDAKQASKFLNIPISKVRSMCRLKQIPFFKIGRYVRFDQGKLVEWLETLERGNGHKDEGF